MVDGYRGVEQMLHIGSNGCSTTRLVTSASTMNCMHRQPAPGYSVLFKHLRSRTDTPKPIGLVYEMVAGDLIQRYRIADVYAANDGDPLGLGEWYEEHAPVGEPELRTWLERFWEDFSWWKPWCWPRHYRIARIMRGLRLSC